MSALNPEVWSKQTRPPELNDVDLSNTKWGRIEAITVHEATDAPSRAQRAPTSWNNEVKLKGRHFMIGNNPDHIFALTETTQPTTRHFFLEADRGTETVRPTAKHLNKSTIYKKLLGHYHTHCDKLHRTVFGDWMQNFCVLWVIDSPGTEQDTTTRLDSFLTTTREVTDGRLADLFLFTTYDALRTHGNPLTHRWVNAKGERRQLVPSS